jgi:hypothetical protein
VDLSAAVLTAGWDVIDDNALHERTLEPDKLSVELGNHIAEKNVIPVYSHVEVGIVILKEKSRSGEEALTRWEYNL